MNRHISFIVAAAVLLGGATESFGGLVTIQGDPRDGVVDVNGLPQDFAFTQLRTGVGGDNVRGLADIFFFALPTVPSSASITSAVLEFQYLGVSVGSPGIFVTPEFSVDLFGLGARSTAAILSTDYHDGHASLSPDALIAQAFITPSTIPGALQASGGTLLNFVRSLYQSDGTPIAAFAVFRANPDKHLPVFSGRLRGYELASADNTDSGGAFVPELRLNVAVPEPQSIVVSCCLAIMTAAASAVGRVNGSWNRLC